jgi:hypothetical protein
MLGSLEFEQGAAHDRAHDLVVNRRREVVGVGQHRLALVVPQHRHPEVADLPGADFGEGVSHHDPMSGVRLAQPLVHVLDLHEQPALQLGRVELVGRGIHEADTVSVSRPDRSTVPGRAPVAAPSRQTSTPPTHTEVIPYASATKRGAPAGRS